MKTEMGRPNEDRGDLGLSRRGFLRATGLGAMASGLAAADGLAASGSHRSLILLMMVGGPSQFETFDPKPSAPESIRGPFRAIQTSQPGVRISEHLPRIAQRMDRLSLIRSLHHDEAPIHETGLQLVQTGRISRGDVSAPHVGSVAARLLGQRGDVPPFVILPRPIGNTGVAICRGQSAGVLGERFNPTHANTDRTSSGLARALSVESERPSVVESYGKTEFGRRCLQARRLVEAGTRVVTVNMEETVFDRVSWDCHGSAPFSTFDDYARTLLPTFDRAYAALLDDLEARGLLDSTLIVATGEFGRSPRINEQGGRDHWPAAWSALLAGGGTPRGACIGATDRQGAEPSERPVTPADLVASIYHGLGINPQLEIDLANGSSLRLVEQGRPIHQMFA